MANKYKILFVSAEVAPFAKSGGLADVAGSLPQYLAGLGHDVRTVMPKYKMIKQSMDYLTDYPVRFGDRVETCVVREVNMSINASINADASIINYPVYFIDNYNYFDRENIYCCHDDGDRFAFFCKAVLEMLPVINFQPDVIHCNDWHTGPICMLLKEKYMNNLYYSNMASVYTIHNLQYQGHFGRDILRLFDINEDVFTPEKVEFYGAFNFMKAGLVYADVITTVSETYAKEIQTNEYGEKLEGLIKKRAADLMGIVNGISYSEFNPENDKKIYANYSKDCIDNKRINKRELQKELGLPESNAPLMGLISRLSGQKGLDLIISKIDSIIENDLQFVLLGTGDEYYENAFREINKKYPRKFYAHLGFNAQLAQKIYAGSDIFLMPSRFEPCGLGQIISFRYGTIPVVRATGGLAETVLDFDVNSDEGTGFSFAEYSPNALYEAIIRALKVYNEKPDEWKKLVTRALALDFSWDKSSRKYEEVYHKAISKANFIANKK